MKQAIIFCNRALDGQTVTRLLAWDSAMDVIGWDADLDHALQRIQQIRPEIIIVASEESSRSPSAQIAYLLQETTNITLVEVGLHDRTVCIYRGEPTILRQIEDLLQGMA